MATVALGKAGARNAAFLSARIIALNDPAVRERLEAYREENREQILADAAAVERDHAERG